MSTNSERDALATVIAAHQDTVNGDEFGPLTEWDLGHADAILKSDWLAEHDRAVAAAAWDEGYGDDLTAHEPRENPYLNALVADERTEK